MPRPLVALFAFLLPVSLLAAGHDLSTTFRSAPSDSQSGIATVAFNSNHFLTLWPMASHIYGSLADPASGTAPAFPVLPYVNTTVIKVTAAGSGYLAVWIQQSVPFLGTLNPAGVLERSVPLDASTLTDPKIAFNGKTILVVDRTGNFVPPATIVASLYDLEGHSIARYTLPVSGADSFDVTNADGEFAVVTAGISGVNEWRVANDGTILSTVQIEPPPANQILRFYTGSVAWKSGRTAVGWMQLQTAVLSFAILQTDGSITRVALPNGGVSPAFGMTVLPVDIGFVVAWNVQPAPPDKPAVFALRLDLGGALLDQRPVNLGGEAGFSSAASSGNAIGFALFTSSWTAPTTLITTLGPNGFSIRPASPTAVTPVRQVRPVVTGSSAGFTAAWIERSSGVRNVAIRRVAHDGQALDGPGIALDEKSASSAAIAQGASEALVVWTTNDSVLARRVTPFGVRLDATPLLITKQHFHDPVAVAWNGSRYFTVWSTGDQIVGAFVGSDDVVTTPKPLTNRTIPSRIPAVPDVTWDGRQFIVAFGDSPVVNCGPCTVPIPNQIRVLRVSSTGDAIDVIPLQIPGEHIRAHVASSGAESLIALDSHREISTVIVHDEDGVLHLDPEVSLFHWPLSAVSSDVTWDGANYIVGWEYLDETFDPRSGWLAAARVTRTGLPFGSIITSVGPPESVSYTESWGPSIAANDAGEVALTISETLPTSYVPRARLYLMTDLAPMPAAPPAPCHAVSYFGGGKARINWQSDDVPGFLIEWSYDFGSTWRYYTVLPGDARSVTVLASIGNLFRISAFGPGGVSASTITSIGR